MDRRTFLKSAAATAAASTVGAQSRPLNVVMIYADDLGYGDLGCYGSKIRTPNLDRLASEGIRFTNFNSANPVCSPSRAALLTGRYPTRVGVPRVLFPNDTVGLPDDEMTLAQVLKQAGHRTMCVGKWHLGHLPRYLPMKRGFDSYFGIPYSNDMKPAVLLRGEEIVEQNANQDTLTQRYTEEAVKFIDASGNTPFFLYFPHTFPHIPLHASSRFRGKSPLGLYGDVVEELDWSVGEVLKKLAQTGVESNTLVLFSSDNGPWYQGSPGLLRGRKGMTWEGGVREPFIARLPGRIPSGTVCHGFGSMMDIFPTVAKLCGAQLPGKPLDGIDIWPMLSGAKPRIERDPVLYFDNIHLQCARWNDWKLHIARHNHAKYSPPPAGGSHSLRMANPELYNLALDPAESYDVAAEHPDIVRRITGYIEARIRTFPPEIVKAYEDAGKSAPRPAGTYTRPA
ncbi:MAG: sulfatase [Acidobacteria bacterium]|nr:sulfatase [Acidobacteriota bacterium]